MITREQIKQTQGMAAGQMRAFCPDRLEKMKEIVGDGYPLIYNGNDWVAISFKPKWDDITTYFPTKAQLDAYFAPKKKTNQEAIDLLKQAIALLEAK